MDPNECLRLASQALEECDHATAREHLENYRTWRAKGGFEPPDRGDKFATECEQRIEKQAKSARSRNPGHTITCALRVAAEQYRKDAETAPEVRTTFQRQAMEALAIADAIEERGLLLFVTEPK